MSANGRGGVDADVTRAVAVDDFESVDDPDLVERHAREAERMAERHDPDETT